MMVNASHKEKMLRFQIPNELKDDLVYCQRSLRHFVKVHQLLASKLANGLTKSQITKLKRNLQELEGQMIDIGNEQRSLVRELNVLVRDYIEEMSVKEFVDIDPEIADGFVTRALSVHYEMSFNTKYAPKNVSERMNEAQLVHKYELSFFDEPCPKKEKDESESSTSSSISPTTTHPYNQRQISLLKPKEERVGAGTTKNMQTLNNITFSNANALVNEHALNKIAPETIAVPKKLIKIPPKIESLPRPIPQLPEPVCSPIKQEEEYEPQELSATVAIKNSRMKLRQALNKAKNSNLTQNQPEGPSKPVVTAFASRQKGITKTRSDPLPGSSSKRASSGASSDSSPNSRSSTPLSAKASDDSSVDRVPMPIEEYYEYQPIDIDELKQPMFLKFFGLLTLEESKALTTRKTERKRRSCNSTERKDFHYGKIDYYEQQMTHITRRRHKRPILYSPPATRGVKKRKHFDLIASSTGAGTVRSGLASSASSTTGQQPQHQRVIPAAGESFKLVLTEMENQICIVCNKSGSPDSLSACVYCCNIYHLRCHSNSIFNPQLLRQRDNICPVCLQKKQQATVELQNQQRDQMIRKRLLRRNAHQRAHNERLQQRKQRLEKVFTVKQMTRRRLVEQERTTRDQIAQLMNCVRTLRHDQ